MTFDCAHSRSLLTGEPHVVFINHVGPRGYLGLLKSLIPALRILFRLRPQAVYSTGAAIALAFLPFAFLIRARAAYIESAARIDGPSQTGRLLRLLPWVRLRTQYQSWADRRWQFEGAVFDGMQSFNRGTGPRPVRRIVVTLGTQPRYPFVSLVERVRDIIPADVEVLWQIGTNFPEASRPPGAYDLVPAETLRKWVASADAVIAHGGVGSALTALRAGHKPVMVARRAYRNEHVDDHQVQLVEELVSRDLAIAATPLDLSWEHIVASTRAVVEPSELAAIAAIEDRDNSGTPSGDLELEDAPKTAGLRRRALVAVAAVIALVGTGAVVDSADAVDLPVAQSTVVTATPSKATPNVMDGVVYAIGQVGTQMFLGGSFTTVQDQGSTTTLNRTEVLAFDAATGTVSTTFAPTLDGTVEAIYPGPVANTVYIGGFFDTVNGTKSKGIALLDTTTGALVSGWKPTALNGAVYTIATAAGHVLIGGSFTTASPSSSRPGLASLNPNTGALDNYLTVALTGHHNYNGTGAMGALGARAMSVNPAGTRAVVLGNFKNADGVVHDQAVQLDLGAASATVDPWNTTQYSARCASNAFDSYVSDVQYAPDGSYFVIAATGGGTTSANSDGSRSLCDTASRWDAASSATNALPTWVDYTGNDTLWSVAVTGSAIYVGGHQRWLNNPNGSDYAGAGAIPRPGVAALDPVSGLPLTWNPGRNPRGAGAYAVFASASGIYVGSDTDYVGGATRRKIAYFPLTGGAAPASTATAALPANVYVAGPASPEAGFTTSDLYYRPVDSTHVGPSAGVPNTGINWADTRGAFVVGSSIFYGTSAGNFYRASFDGTTVGTPTLVDPYNDPKWSSVDTGSGQTYVGVKPMYYSSLSTVTGAFYSGGRLFYTVAGSTQLYWRWFSPDSGAIGGMQFSTTAFDFSRVAGMFASGGYIYWASSADGTLHKVQLTGTAAVPGTDTIVGGPAIDGKNWRAQSLFPYGPPSFPNTLPTAKGSGSCTQLNCSFDGTTSTDSDGSVASYAWSFGDGTTGTGAHPTHGYAAAGTYSVSLTVTDNRGGTSPAWTGQVTATAPTKPVSFVATAGRNGTSTATPSVVVPASVQAGDTELLYVGTGTDGVTTATPSGWQQIARQTTAPLETTVYRRTAVAGDAGSTVTVNLASSVQVDLRLVVYSGASSVTATTAGDTATTATHVTPTATATAGGSWLVSYWDTRTSSASVWTAPSSVTPRATGANGSIGGHVDSLIGDSGPLASGTYGSLSASSGSAGGKAAMISIVLTPTA